MMRSYLYILYMYIVGTKTFLDEQVLITSHLRAEKESLMHSHEVRAAESKSMIDLLTADLHNAQMKYNELKETSEVKAAELEGKHQAAIADLDQCRRELVTSVSVSDLLKQENVALQINLNETQSLRDRLKESLQEMEIEMTR